TVSGEESRDAGDTRKASDRFLGGSPHGFKCCALGGIDLQDEANGRALQSQRTDEVSVDDIATSSRQLHPAQGIEDGFARDCHRVGAPGEDGWAPASCASPQIYAVPALSQGGWQEGLRGQRVPPQRRR